MNTKNSIKTILIVAIAVCMANASFGYKVWLGTHKWEGAAANNLDQWDMAIDKIDGINYVTLDVRPDRPAGDGANASDWNTMIAPIDQSIPGMAEISRSQYEPASSRTLASRMVNEFATAQNNGGYEIDIIMLYDEEKNGTVWKFDLQDVQDVRAWLDNNGHADIPIVFRLTNNDQERLALAQQSIVDGVLIEASATRWVEDRFNVHTLLQDLWTDSSTSYKNIYFQIPRSETPGTVSQRNGLPTSPINQYIETRRALLVIKDLMGDAFMQSDQCIFIVCNYGDTFPTYPETASNDTLYVNSKSGVALSLIEQRPIFEGLVGVVNEALCSSYDRYEVNLGPTSGLVAHWPMDEGSGTDTTNAAGTSFTATLLNGASWGSDASRDSYVVFDGTDDRIATTFTYALHATNDFTWAWWAKMEPTSHSGSIMVGNRYGNTGSQTYEFIKMTPTKGAFANTDSTGSIENYDYADIAASSWHHYAMVKSGTNYQWYVDGVAQGSTVTINYNENSALPFLIGGDDDGSGTKVNEHFEGCIDDVVLYRSALAPSEVTDVQNGIYAQTIPMAAAALGSPVNLIDGSTWDDGQPPHGGFNYLVPNTGNIKSEDGTSSFAGYSLTVEGGGKFQFRAKHELGETTTVDKLIATGGTSGNFVNLAAGTGNNTTNHLDGTLQNDGFTKLTGFGNSTGPRNIRISSQISGTGTLHSTGTSAYPHTCTIGNAVNTFSGIWESNIGTLEFESAGAVGTADVEVLTAGKLSIAGDWDAGATLTVADSANAEVDVGTYLWTVSNLVIGSTSVGDGLHTVAQLNALGANPVFTGSGKLRVGPPPAYELIAAWDTWDSATAPGASFMAANITASATASGTGGNWSNSDTGSDPGRGSSDDTTWGTYDGGLNPASAVTTNGPANFTLTNAKTDGEITFTITNAGTEGILLNQFHFDAVAFRTKAARTYALNVLAGSDITVGNVFTSPNDAITDLGGALSGHDQHDDIDLSLSGLADHTLEAGGTAIIQLAFYSGVGDGSGGHHLFVDNVGVSGAFHPGAEPPVLEYGMSGGDMVFSWTGGGFKVQSRTNLTEGTWQNVSGGEAPPVTNSPTYPEEFFRLIEQ